MVVMPRLKDLKQRLVVGAQVLVDVDRFGHVALAPVATVVAGARLVSPTA